MVQLKKSLVAEVDPERLKNLTLDLVRIPSPPGQERAVAEFYADYLQQVGLAVELDEEYPDSPSVVARLRGQSGRPTLQLDGHTDTIELAGPDPRFEDGYIYGRGAEDMKAALAAMAEAARVLIESDVQLEGDLLLTAHGRHESATNETLEALIAKGIYGDAVIVTELGGHDLPIAGMGLAFFEIQISREGDIVHETVATPDAVHPISAGHRALEILREHARNLTKEPLPYLGHESIFIGKFQSGDYFNRLPKVCTIAGTRRFGPERRLPDIRREFEDLSHQIAVETNTQVEVWLDGVDGFQISEDERLVGVLRRAHRRITRKELPLSGTRTAANAPHFVHLAGVPAVYYGATYLTAHSDHERVALDEVVRATQVYIHAIVDFLGKAEM